MAFFKLFVSFIIEGCHAPTYLLNTEHKRGGFNLNFPLYSDVIL